MYIDYKIRYVIWTRIIPIYSSINLVGNHIFNNKLTQNITMESIEKISVRIRYYQAKMHIRSSMIYFRIFLII